jgi:hypothetical protein
MEASQMSAKPALISLAIALLFFGSLALAVLRTGKGDLADNIPYTDQQGIGGDHSCLFAGVPTPDVVVFRNQQELEDRRQCFYGALPSFDFETSSLVGVWLHGGGCDFPEFEITAVTKDEASRTITISILVREFGICAYYHGVMKWLSFEPIPADHAVIAVFNTRVLRG